MKIVSITVTDDQGVVHTFEGVEGHLIVRTDNYKGEPNSKSVNAFLRLPEGEVLKA